jgi:hypothetical protein
LGPQSKLSIIIEKLDPKKPSFRPSKWPRKLKTAKNSKLPKLSENQNQKIVLSELKKVGGHRYPPGSLLDMVCIYHTYPHMGWGLVAKRSLDPHLLQDAMGE